ncbi:MAG: ABC transporter substrate-binding protein [Deltaproteobacteria bacterium]|nr:ABC transporter substrate-binding protein [Deltaproteobacteria bacterium]MCF8118727.1 ABC transporter substrate-binding protein [Deltaproteobacteria bacterium]
MGWIRLAGTVAVVSCLWVLTEGLPVFGAGSPDPIMVGLDADMSSGSARSGEAIRRGIVLAMDEINGRGGVLGRPLQLVVKDHRGNPARGVDNIKAFGDMKNLVAVVGGLHTPVALAELEAIHKNRIIYLDPWAAGTPVVDNGYDPNFVFRVSVRDEYAGGFLVDKALEMGHKKVALLLEQTGWGRSNERSMKEALKTRWLRPVTIQWFHWGVQDLTRQIRGAREAGADVIILVANAPEGIVAVTSMAGLPPEQRLHIISHWGITGGEFFKHAEERLKQVHLVFLQTYSFLDPPFPEKAEALFSAYQKKFPECNTVEDIFAPVGTAHAYDLMHLLALAIEKAGTTDRPAVRKALENLDPYQGLVRYYDPAFTKDRHDALDASDFSLARYTPEGIIVPFKVENHVAADKK